MSDRELWRRRYEQQQAKDVRRFAWARLNAYGLLISALCMLQSLHFFAAAEAPLAQAIGTLPPFQGFWLGGFILGGTVILIALILGERYLEVVGVVLVGLSLVVQFVSTIAMLGWHPLTVGRGVTALVGIACLWLRADALLDKDGMTVTIPPRGARQ